MAKTKLQKLEAEIATLTARLALIEERLSPQWVKLPDAARIFGCNAQTLRRKIHQAKADPKKSGYVQGIHWRGARNYQINVNKWSQVEE